MERPQREFVRWARVARLATVGPDGTPHNVPICPALDGGRLVFATDETAKVRNIRGNPRVAIVFDHYVEDWDLNHQVMIQGTARILSGGPHWERAKRLLDEKYRQYEPMSPIVPGESLIVEVTINRVTSDGF